MDENKITFCAMCTEEQHVEEIDNETRCMACGSLIPDGIIERDERIAFLEKKVYELLPRSKYEVGLQVVIREVEEIFISVVATTEKEAIEKAKKLYQAGDIDYADFTAFGDRESTLQEDVSSWHVILEEQGGER